jgi:hypothetical protein
MTGHLSDGELLDLVGADAPEHAAEHLRGCRACAQRLRDARDGLALARAGALPEPSPPDWRSFQAELKRRIETAPARPRLVPALAAAAALVAALLVVSPRPSRAPDPVAPLPAWTPLPPAETDVGLWVLEQALVAADDLAAVAPGCAGVGDCLASLSDDETAALAEVLRHGSSGEGL